MNLSRRSPRTPPSDAWPQSAPQITLHTIKKLAKDFITLALEKFSYIFFFFFTGCESVFFLIGIKLNLFLQTEGRFFLFGKKKRSVDL